MVTSVTGSSGVLHCPASGGSTILHIASPGEDQNLKFEILFWLNAHCFCIIIKSKNWSSISWDHLYVFFHIHTTWSWFLQLYEVCPEGIQPCDMKKRHLLKKYKMQETLSRGQWHLSPLPRRHLGTSHSSPSHHQLSCRIFLNLINGLKSLPFQRWY